MDFTFTPEQDEAAALAAKILKDRATNDRMKAVEAGGRPVRPRAVGRARLAPGSWACTSPRSTTAPGSASSSCAGSSSRSAGRSRRCRWPRTAPPRA